MDTFLTRGLKKKKKKKKKKTFLVSQQQPVYLHQDHLQL